VTRTSKRLTTTLVAMSAAALLGTACGDDDGGSPDANTTPDAASPADAARPDATPPRHTGTVAVSEVTVTTPGAPGVRGGAISIIYSDPADTAGEVAFGVNPPISTCYVKKYTPADAESPATNEGTITIAGNGLLKPVGECAFAEGLGYECTIDSGNATIAIVNLASTLYQVTLTGEEYSDVDLVGSSIRLSGYAGAEAVYNGTWSVVGQTNGKGATLLNIVIPTPGLAAPLAAAHDYRLLGGFGPVPTTGLGAVDTDFLGGAGTTVSITKADTAAPGAPALAVNLPPAGEGFELDGEGDAILAHEFPFTAAPVTFTCGDTCGALPTGATAGLQVIAVSGRTTDAILPNPPTQQVPPFFMPPVSATRVSYATFQCTFFETAPAGSNSFTATMPQAAVEAILSTNPTRIETRVFRFSASQAGANVLVGHGVVGHSSPPPPSN
jgi:hypothetical protein